MVTVFTVDMFTFHYIQFPSSCLPLPPGGGRGFPVPLQERGGILGERGACFPSAPSDYQKRLVCHFVKDWGMPAVLIHGKGQEKCPRHSSWCVGSQVLQITEFILVCLQLRTDLTSSFSGGGSDY